MRKKAVTGMMGLALAAMMFTGCGAANGEDGGAAATVEESAEKTQEAEPETGGEQESAQAEPAETETAAAPETDGDDAEAYEAVDVRVGSLKGPTSMGLVYLMDQADKGEAANNYTFTMAAAADELLPSMISGDLDIVLVPANVAGVLYNKTVCR